MSYGCFNRPPLKDHHWVQVGHMIDELAGTRIDKMTPMTDPMTKTCQYQKDDKYSDPGCMGCVHKKLLGGNTLDLFDGTQSPDTEKSAQNIK
jgi:hypothetical protein